MEDDFTAQVQRFVRSAVFFAVVAVTFRFAFQTIASKQCFRDRSQLKLRFWWMGVSSLARVETIIAIMWRGANFAEDMKTSSWPAQYFARVGGVEVKFSWQAQES